MGCIGSIGICSTGYHRGNVEKEKRFSLQRVDIREQNRVEGSFSERFSREMLPPFHPMRYCGPCEVQERARDKGAGVVGDKVRCVGSRVLTRLYVLRDAVPLYTSEAAFISM